ncbi:hypothetical protein QL285_046902 [Trifolium repens]|nr:hypothetical protein QL285_046902 [Trifolium repens]
MDFLCLVTIVLNTNYIIVLDHNQNPDSNIYLFHVQINFQLFQNLHNRFDSSIRQQPFSTVLQNVFLVEMMIDRDLLERLLLFCRPLCPNVPIAWLIIESIVLWVGIGIVVSEGIPGRKREISGGDSAMTTLVETYFGFMILKV